MNHTSSRNERTDYYVPYREFDRTIDVLQEDISEIKADVKTLLAAGSEGRGAAAARKAMLAAMLMLVSAGWWLPDLIHRHP